MIAELHTSGNGHKNTQEIINTIKHNYNKLLRIMLFSENGAQ